MYTAIIVDDNPADRRGIPTLLDWSGLGIEIAGTCSNGEEAIQVLCRKKIDIVLTDIVMPIMNGIELAEHIQESFKRTKIVFMSCYSDFEYARTAVDMKIYGYVLKPIIPLEFEKVIHKLLQEFAEENIRESEKEEMVRQIHDMLPAVREQFFRELLSLKTFKPEEISHRMEFLRLGDVQNSRYAVLSLIVNHYDTDMQELNSEDFYYVSFSIKELMSAFLKPGMRAFPLSFSGEDYSIVIFLSEEAVARRYGDVMDMAVEIHTAIASKLKIGTTIGISRISGDLAEAHALYRQSVESCRTSFYGEGNPIVLYETIESKSLPQTDRETDFAELHREIKEIAATGDETAAADFIGRLFGADAAALPERHARTLALTIVNMVAVVMIEMEYSFSDAFGRETAVWEALSRQKTTANIRSWLLSLFKTLREYISVKNRSRSSRLVDTVKRIIMERYHEQITVDDISREVFLSQRYANSIFKKETGKTIFDYLLEFRLEAAKKLLADKDSRIAEVCEKVGYENKSYFALMFKRYTGLSPTEYKARFSR